MGGIENRYKRMEPPNVPTGQYARNQLNEPRSALVRVLADAATQPVMLRGGVPTSGRAPAMTALVIPRGPK